MLDEGNSGIEDGAPIRRSAHHEKVRRPSADKFASEGQAVRKSAVLAFVAEAV
jgi:hypothetical protein